ncbi:uncharacterized protein LOC131217673 [Magnolia sinica]|uniref:uncharacterized protein LOC131217673 n=1 Tax=Magnolia sinica TaxID=86752 RepID=UPI002659323E|nr:uncharacterized protein LOC131217673 [Magnolia sinica]
MEEGLAFSGFPPISKVSVPYVMGHIGMMLISLEVWMNTLVYGEDVIVCYGWVGGLYSVWVVTFMVENCSLTGVTGLASPVALSTDFLRWLKDKSGKFSVKSLYRFINEDGEDAEIAATTYVWQYGAPLKAAVFGWLVGRNKVLTIDNLSTVLLNACPLCMQDEESVNHMFLHSSFAREVWDLFFQLSGVLLVLPGSIDDFLLSWHGGGTGKSEKRSRRLSCLAVLWPLWLERNSQVFKNKSERTINVFRKAKGSQRKGYGD